MWAYAGPAHEAEQLLEPFNEIESISSDSGDVPYPEIPGVQAMSEDSPECDSHVYVGSSAGLLSYNVTTHREIYKRLNETLARYPSLAPGSTVTFEGYSTKAVQEKDPKLSAYPHRDDLHLVYVGLQLLHLCEDEHHANVEHRFYTAAILDPAVKAPAQQLATEIRDLWYTSQPGRQPTTYVNYAQGGESLESIYGYESWRLKRLLKLKAKYDPNNRFRFYVPLISQ